MQRQIYNKNIKVKEFECMLHFSIQNLSELYQMHTRKLASHNRVKSNPKEIELPLQDLVTGFEVGSSIFG
jgi:hypothetical protein